MGTPAAGRAGKVGVIRCEQFLGGRMGGKLHQPASSTQKHFERVGDLGQS